MNMHEYDFIISAHWTNEKKSLKQLRYDKPLIQQTITRAIDSTCPSNVHGIEILVEQLRSCLFVNAWWMKGVKEKLKEKKRERNVSQLSDILICKSTGFFFQHDNKSLLLLHFCLLMWCDLYSMQYEFKIELAIYSYY